MSIINPWVIYLIGIIDGLNTFIYLMTAFSFAGLISSAVIFVTELDEKACEIHKKVIKIFSIVLPISILLLIFVPNKQTLVYMLVAKNITVENVKAGKDTVKETVDYIFEKIKEVK